MIEFLSIMQGFCLVFAVGAVIEAIAFHLAMYKPRDYRYGKYMLGSFVMFCLGLGGWFTANLVKSIHLELVARSVV